MSLISQVPMSDIVYLDEYDLFKPDLTMSELSEYLAEIDDKCTSRYDCHYYSKDIGKTLYCISSSDRMLSLWKYWASCSGILNKKNKHHYDYLWYRVFY